VEQLVDSKSHHSNAHEIPSDRSWGLTIGSFLVLLAIYWKDQRWLSTAFGITGILLIMLAALIPKRLHQLNINWMRLGAWLSRFTNPVLLGLVYLMVVTPMSLLVKIFGKRFLKTQIETNAETYWVERSKKKIEAKSLERQF
jgi:hypothetical protein